MWKLTLPYQVQCSAAALDMERLPGVLAGIERAVGLQPGGAGFLPSVGIGAYLRICWCCNTPDWLADESLS